MSKSEIANNFSRRSLLKWSLTGAALPILSRCRQQPSENEKAGVRPHTPTSSRTVPIPKLRIAISNQVNKLDNQTPLHVNEFNTNILISGQLYRLDHDKQPYPDLVEEKQVSSDGLTIQMTLKPNLVYSDGTPLKAEDALLALERANKMEGRLFFTPVESLQAPDDRTLIWKMRAIYPDFYVVLGFQYIIFHPKERVETDKDYWRHPVSAGPYQIQEWTPGTNRMVLIHNPNYVGGEMMVKELEFITVMDLTSRVLQLSTGAVDWVFELPFSSAASLPKEARGVPHPQGGMFHITINLDKPGPLQDPKVRQALSLAIDRDAVSRKAFFGVSAPAEAMMFKGVDEFAPTLPNGGKQDLEGAKELLLQTEYPNGFEFSLMTPSARTGWPEATLVIAEDLKKIGVTAQVDLVEDAVMLDRARSGDYDATWTGTVQSPIPMLKIVYISPSGLWAEVARYQNSTVSDLLMKAEIEPDGHKRRALVTEVEKITLQDMPHIPVCERALLNGSRVRDDIFALIKHQNYMRVKTVAEMKSL